jgi:hypothetical protein
MEDSCERGNEPPGFHKMLGNYRAAAQLKASRAVLSYTVSLLVDEIHK